MQAYARCGVIDFIENEGNTFIKSGRKGCLRFGIEAYIRCGVADIVENVKETRLRSL